jgi:hypothetical protein
MEEWRIGVGQLGKIGSTKVREFRRLCGQMWVKSRLKKG